MKENIFYFITGTQTLYGEEIFKEIDQNSNKIVDFINSDKNNPATLVYKQLVKSSDEIKKVIDEVNNDANVAGVILWMHTFSPAKMWIKGLTSLQKPMLHLHTQANLEIPLNEIDMDFMNLNQSAHGDREFGFLATRLRLNRKVVTGYYQDKRVLDEIFSFMRAASAVKFSKNLNVIRLGDNMREVAVTEGDKVEAQIKLGWSVNGYGIGDFVDEINKITTSEVESLFNEIKSNYDIITNEIDSIKEQLKYELALENMLKKHNAKAFTTTFENLYGLKQLPGLSVQRLMEKGYGFGGEGDWKIAALTATLKYMAKGLNGGTSFMEDYTYNLKPNNEYVLGSHMLEICPTLKKDKVSIDVKPLGIGGKNPPARMIFQNEAKKDAVVATLVDMGDRFRMIVNVVDLFEEKLMPKLPVAQILWKPQPSLHESASAWIYAGGAHHTVLSTQLKESDLRNFAEILDIEYVLIDKNTNLNNFVESLRVNDLIWKLKGMK